MADTTKIYGSLEVKGASLTVNSQTVPTISSSSTLTNKTIVVANNTVTTAASGNLAATELNTALAELQTDIDTRALASDLSTHISDTTTHGTTGDIVGTSDTQTLTNKTINGSSNTITNVSLTTGVTGILPIANGGTNSNTANGGLNNLLPTQTGNNGKVLQTNGSNTSWASVSLASAGDINETSFSITNDQSAAADVTGFAFANGTVRSFKALVSVAIDASADLFEAFELLGVQNGSGWYLGVQSVGDNSQIIFSITAAGQLQYTSANLSGYVSGTMKFKAITTSI